MRNLILMTLDKAGWLTDDELAHEIGQLESGKKISDCVTSGVALCPSIP